MRLICSGGRARAQKGENTSGAETNSNTRIPKSSKSSKVSLNTPQKASQKTSIDTVVAEEPGASIASVVVGAVIVPAVVTPNVIAPAAPLAAPALVPVIPEGPHASLPPSRSRHIPAHIRRAVFKRDGLACTYHDPISGRRCGSQFALELDHRIAFAEGGLHSTENLTVRCRARNQWAAQQIFGPNKMSQYGK